MKIPSIFLLSLILFLSACQQLSPIQQFGQHYQKHQDSHSLRQVVELMPEEADTAFVKSILGQPIDMGFDYRYLIDSLGPKGCAFGAVFHINEQGKIDQKWLDEICE